MMNYLKSIINKSTLADDYALLEMSNDKFIVYIYERLLGRYPDDDGFNHYMELLDKTNNKRRVIEDIEKSYEYKNKNRFMSDKCSNNQTIDHSPQDHKSDINKSEVIHIAFKITGGIGDHLIAARFISDMNAHVGQFTFDIFSSRVEIVNWIFDNIEGYRKCADEYFSWGRWREHDEYHLALVVQQCLVIKFEDCNFKEVAQRNPKLIKLCEYADRFRNVNDLNEIISSHPRLDGYLGSKAAFMNLNRFNFSHAMSGIPYRNHILPVKKKIPDILRRINKKTYITVHNGYDAEFLTKNGFANKCTKYYPYYDKVIVELKERFPELIVIQIGTNTSTPIISSDFNLINAITLEEVSSLLENAIIHLDCESGLVHLNACVGGKSCVVFGPTPSDYFAYNDNINILPSMCGGCWWVTKDWMTTCPKGYVEPVCTYNTSPNVVVSALIPYIEKIINNHKKNHKRG